MSALLPIVVAVLGWAVLAVVGVVVLALVPDPARRRLLPAAPLLGVLLMVASLSLTAFFTSVRNGMLVLALVVVTIAVATTRSRGRAVWTYRRQDLAVALAAAVLGLGPFALAVLPSLHAHGQLVQPTGNHDAAFYVSLTEWLEHHDGVHAPVITQDPTIADAAPPAFGPTRSAITAHLRIGESLTQAGLNTVLRTDSQTTYYAFTALWAALVLSSVTAAARLLRLPPLACLSAALAVSVLPLTIRQVYNQNAASLLGIALAPLVLAMFGDAVSRRRTVPVWLAALGLGGLVGVYLEYLSILVPAAVLLTFVRAPREWPRALGAAAATTALAVAIVPLGWWKAYESASTLAGITDNGMTSPFLNGGKVADVGRMIGAHAQRESSRLIPVLVVLLLALLVVGLALALLPRTRHYAVSVAGAAALLIAWYSTHLRDKEYTQGRIVELGMPLLVTAAALGWAGLVSAFSGPPNGRSWQELPLAVRQRVPERRRRALAAVLAAGAVLVAFGVYARTDFEQGLPAMRLAETRNIDGTYAEAADWVAELGGQDGRDVTAVVPDFYQQLWLVMALHDEPAVSYPVLRVDYLTLTQAWAGEADPYLLVDNYVLLHTDPSAVVRRNDRFTLLDLRRGSVVVAVLEGQARATLGTTVPLAQDDLLVLRSPQDADEPLSIAVQGDAPLTGWTASGPGVTSSQPVETVDGPRLLLQTTGQIVRVTLTPPAGADPAALPSLVESEG